MKPLEWVKRERQAWENCSTYEAKIGTMSYIIQAHLNTVLYHPDVLAARPDLKEKEGVFEFYTASYGPNDKPGIIPMTRLSNDNSTFEECKHLCQSHYESILTA